VEEDEKTFLDIKTVIGIIIDAGGIPCYPVLLDDSSGKITEYEKNKEELDDSLSELGVKAIELIPGRNEHSILESFAEWFDNKGYIVTFGTEHNTPEMIPLTVSARGLKSLSMKLAEINSKGVAVLAAHQYLRARGLKGFTTSGGRAESDEIAYFKSLGMAVIDCFLKKDQDEN
jgi:hypothetical protein